MAVVPRAGVSRRIEHGSPTAFDSVTYPDENTVTNMSGATRPRPRLPTDEVCPPSQASLGSFPTPA